MRRVGMALLALGLAGVLLLVLGSLRYGGPEGLLLRVQAEIATYRPHEAFVPTPLPTRISSQLVPSASPTAQPSTEPSSSPTPSPLPSQTALPSPTATATPPPTATPKPLYVPVAPAVELTGFRHEWQGWNNCGPTTLAMNLSYYGSKLRQYDIAKVVRPHKDDKRVDATELVAYAQSQGFNAILRVHGSADRLKLFLSNGVPVMLSTWHETKDGDAMGHYRLVTGYNDAEQEWILYDSLSGTVADKNAPYKGIRVSYAELERLWQVTNYKHIIVYPDELEPLVLSILGDEINDDVMWQRSLADARARVEQQPGNAFAWFTLGSNLVGVGQYEQAAGAYDRARTLGLPFRMMWYQHGAFEAYYRVGRYDELLALANATLKDTQGVEEVFYWKGRGLQATGDPVGAREAYKRALALRPTYAEAQAALAEVGE